MVVKGNRQTDVVSLTPKRPALWLGFHFEKTRRGKLRILIAEKAWDNLADALTLAHEAPDAPLVAWSAIRAWVSYMGPCYIYTDLGQAWDRMAALARNLAFDEIPDSATVEGWWQRAHGS